MKQLFFFAVLFSLLFTAQAFDWPVKDFQPETLSPSFGQNRKQHFNMAVTFSGAQEVLAADEGRLVIVISEHQNEGGFFESTLGNCAVIAHEDNLISIYGNLEKESAQECLKKEYIAEKESLGTTASSAWHKNDQSLEFQISDNAGKTFLNPLILMPKISSSRKITLDDLTLENRLGRSYTLSNLRSIPAGSYKVFKAQKENICVNTASVYVNGTELETITKETLKQNKSLLSVSGRELYSSPVIYPDGTKELLGTIMLPHGSNTVSVTVKDFFGNERTATFNIQAY